MSCTMMTLPWPCDVLTHCGLVPLQVTARLNPEWEVFDGHDCWRTRGILLDVSQEELTNHDLPRISIAMET